MRFVALCLHITSCRHLCRHLKKPPEESETGVHFTLSSSSSITVVPFWKWRRFPFPAPFSSSVQSPSHTLYFYFKQIFRFKSWKSPRKIYSEAHDPEGLIRGRRRGQQGSPWWVRKTGFVRWNVMIRIHISVGGLAEKTNKNQNIISNKVTGRKKCLKPNSLFHSSKLCRLWIISLNSVKCFPVEKWGTY